MFSVKGKKYKDQAWIAKLERMLGQLQSGNEFCLEYVAQLSVHYHGSGPQCRFIGNVFRPIALRKSHKF